jgi:hypothetical protein
MANVTYYNPGFGQLNGPMSIVNNLAAKFWYTCRQFSVDTTGINLVTSYPNLYCLQLEDASHTGNVLLATYWDQTTTQSINFTNAYVSPLQPWITNLKAASSTTVVKGFFVSQNPNTLG